VVTETLCACRHSGGEHQDGGGRCEGQCVDQIYGTYRCLCPYYTEERL